MAVLSLETPRDELFAGWRLMWQGDLDEATKEQGLYQLIYMEWQIAQEGLMCGQLDEDKLRVLINKFIPVNDQLSPLTSLARLWYQLGQTYPAVDRKFAERMWRWGLEQTTDPYKAAVETAYYVQMVKPDEGVGLMAKAEERLREVLPSVEAFPRVFDQNRVDRLGYLTTFVINGGKFGYPSPDLRKYLIECLRGADLSKCYGVTTYYLLRFLDKSDLTEAEKRQIIKRVLFETVNLPHEEGDYVHEAVTTCFLGMNDFENATAVWAMMRTDPNLDTGLMEIIVYALRRGEAARARVLFGDYERISGVDQERNPRIEWRRSWYWAALLATKEGPGFYLDQPEVTVWLIEGHQDTRLAELWRICRKPEHRAKSGRICNLIRERAKLLVAQFNENKLTKKIQMTTLELLLAMGEE